MSAETFGSRWVWEEQPSGLDMEIRVRNAGRTLPSEGVSAMTSAIFDKVRARKPGGGHERLGVLAAELSVSY
jgi:hypothetical protein